MPDEPASRLNKALEQRKARATYDFIARHVGYSDESGTRKAVRSLLERNEAESADD